jgi:dephospho-CoA kinase
VSQRWPDKLIIGLTGNIATGKSAIMKMAAERSALTLDADLLVHEK